MPISATVIELQAGASGTNTRDGIFVFGASDDRLVSGSTTKWARFYVASMPGYGPTSGSYSVAVTISGTTYTSATVPYNASPWTVAQAVTIALQPLGIACVPIDVSNNSSGGSVTYELRDEVIRTPSLVTLANNTLNGSMGAAVSQFRQGPTPSQAATFAWEYAHEDNDSQTNDCVLITNTLNLTNGADDTAALDLLYDALHGVNAGGVSLYAKQTNLTWYVVEVAGDLGLGTNQPSNSPLQLWNVISSIGDDGHPEKQTVALTGTVEGGTFTLTIFDALTPPNYDTTAPIAWTADAVTIRDAIRATGQEPALRGQWVTVTGGPFPSQPIRVCFSPRDGNVPLISVDTSLLTGPTPVAGSIASPTLEATVSPVTAITAVKGSISSPTLEATVSPVRPTPVEGSISSPTLEATVSPVTAITAVKGSITSPTLDATVSPLTGAPHIRGSIGSPNLESTVSPVTGRTRVQGSIASPTMNATVSPCRVQARWKWIKPTAITVRAATSTANSR